MRLIAFFFALHFLFAACRPGAPEDQPLPTSVCVRTLHHGAPVADAVVFIKFNADSFPGYDQPAAFYDDSVRTGTDARGCILAVPEGRHWLVAFGRDDNYFPPVVFGSLPVTISLSGRPQVDTVLHVSEEH